MPLNPKIKSLSSSDADATQAAAALDTAVTAAVATAKATAGVLANQITIVPLGTIFESNSGVYVASAAVLYSTSS